VDAGFRYGALLPAALVQPAVRDTERSVAFYRAVFGAEVHYRDIEFAAMRVGPAEVMPRAGHTQEDHPWHGDLAGGATRGIGAQIRLLGIDPDETQRRGGGGRRRIGAGRRQGARLARGVRARPRRIRVGGGGDERSGSRHSCVVDALIDCVTGVESTVPTRRNTPPSRWRS